MTQCENTQPLEGVAARISHFASAKAQVPGTGLTVLPAEPKTTTMAAVAKLAVI
jgi:hypothetical protein